MLVDGDSALQLGVFAAPRSEVYAATRAGVIAMVKGLGVGQARPAIRATAVSPGWLDTAMTERALRTEAFEEKVLRRIPARRWGIGDDFAGIAVYLASDASAYHTGDSFVIDGGYACF